MRRLKPIAAALLAAGALSACAAHPIVARDPVEPPLPGEAYDCDSHPTVVNAFSTNCKPRLDPRGPALRARG